MQEVIMLKLDLDMDKGVVVNWVRKEGETVAKNDPIAVIESQKITNEIPAPAAGVLRIVVQEGIAVPVGQTIAFIVESGDDHAEVEKKIQLETTKVKGAKASEKPELAAVEKVSEKHMEKVEISPEVRVSPVARRLAEKHNIDITKIKGTGPSGRIVEKDVLEAVEKTKMGPEVARTIPFIGIRKTIAENMVYSYTTAPQVTVTTDVDMMEASKVYKETSVSYTSIFVKAVAKALQEFHEINSTLEGDSIKIFKDINVGVAVATQRGLIVPVVRNADGRSLTELTKIIGELAEKARNDKLVMSEVTRGTFTVTNLGMFGVDAFTPIVTPKQTAILGIGRIIQKPVVIQEQITIRPVTTLSVSFDHRIIDGAVAAQFMQRIKEYVENPNHLV